MQKQLGVSLLYSTYKFCLINGPSALCCLTILFLRGGGGGGRFSL